MKSKNFGTPFRSDAIDSLVRDLSALSGSASYEWLSHKIGQAEITMRDVEGYMRFDPFRYTRNVVAEGKWYTLILLCWRSGQRSTIHDHAGSVCVFRVVLGVCTETVYGFSPCGQVVPESTRDFRVGEIAAARNGAPHQVSNLQDSSSDLVTLHAYSPPLKGLRLYSIFGETLMTDFPESGEHWLPDETKTSVCQKGPTLPDSDYEKVVRYMRGNLKHDIHLADFAKQTGHSLAHFSVIFKRRSGVSPFQYLKDLRMREAHRMIAAGERDLKRVALAVGYSNSGHFAEVFTKFWKYSPRTLVARVRFSSIDRRRGP